MSRAANVKNSRGQVGNISRVLHVFRRTLMGPSLPSRCPYRPGIHENVRDMNVSQG